MIWSGDKERAAACNAILKGVRIGPCFHANGDATHLGKQLRPDLPESDFGCKSHGEQVMLRFAWDVWNGNGKFSVEEALGVLDETNNRILARFYAAWASPDHAKMEAFIDDPKGTEE